MTEKINTGSTGQILKLMTQEGNIIEVEVEIMKQALLIKEMVDDSNGDVEEEIPLPNIYNVTLQRVIEFLKHLKDNSPPDIEKPLRSNNLEDITT